MGLVVGLGLFGAIVFLPLFLQVVAGVSATNSGLLLIPLMAGLLTTSIVSGRLITSTGRYKRYPIIGSVVMTTGMILLSTMSPDISLWLVLAYMLVLGCGVGLVMQVLVIAVQNAVDRSDLGVATSSSQFFRSLGGSFGTAIFGAVLSSRLAVELLQRVPADAMAQIPVENLTGSPALISQLPDAVRTGVINAFSNSITTAFLFAVPFTLAALALALLLPELPLRETVETGASGVEGGAVFEAPTPELG
jgi:MFS family permease